MKASELNVGEWFEWADGERARRTEDGYEEVTEFSFRSDIDYIIRWCYQSHHVPANIHDLAARVLGEPSLAHGCAEVPEPAGEKEAKPHWHDQLEESLAAIPKLYEQSSPSPAPPAVDDKPDHRLRAVVGEPCRVSPTYRAFASAEEFKPHRDRWLVFTGTNEHFKVDSFSDSGICGRSWKYAFKHYRFDNGQPCGIATPESEGSGK